MTDSDAALIAKALAHPARVRIIRLLAEQSECRGSEVFSELPLAQSTISEHLRVLKSAGLVKSHSVGTSMVYCLVSPLLEEFATSIADLSRSAAACVPGQGEC